MGDRLGPEKGKEGPGPVPALRSGHDVPAASAGGAKPKGRHGGRPLLLWADPILIAGVLVGLAGIVWLGVAGPIRWEVGGVRLLRLRHFQRPALLAGVCLGLWLLLRRAWEARRLEALALWPLLAVIGLGAGLTVPHLQLQGFDADTYGYVSEAEALLEGGPIQPEDVFAPRGLPPVPGTTAPIGWSPLREHTARAPTYPVGWPLHLALARLVGGRLGMLMAAPVVSLLLLVAVFLVGRELGGAGVGLLGALLLALSPVWQFGAMSLMSEGAAALWCALGFLALLRSEQRPAWAAAAGAALALAVLVRPNLAVSAVLVGLYLAVRLRWRALGWFLLGALPVAAFQAVWQLVLYGAAWRTGYYGMQRQFGLGFLEEYLGYYGGGLLARHGWPAAVLALAGLCVRGRHRAGRCLLGALFGALLAFYCCYRPGRDWISFRFFAPWLWGVGILAALGLRGSLRRAAPPWRGALAVALLGAVLGSAGAGMIRERRQGPMLYWQRVARIRHQEASVVAARTEPEAVVFSYLHSGILRQHHRSTLTFVVSPDLFGWAVRSLSGQGVPLYLLRHRSVPCPHLEAHPGWFERILETGHGTTLYRVVVPPEFDNHRPPV